MGIKSRGYSVGDRKKGYDGPGRIEPYNKLVRELSVFGIDIVKVLPVLVEQGGNGGGSKKYQTEKGVLGLQVVESNGCGGKKRLLIEASGNVVSGKRYAFPVLRSNGWIHDE